MRTLATVAGLLGGLCWVGALWVDLLALVGAVVLAVAVMGAGAGLVSKSAMWLRVIVAICLLALAGSVLQVLRDNLDQELVLAVSGVVAVVVAAYSHSRRPAPAHHSSRSRGTRSSRSSRGSHAA